VKPRVSVEAAVSQGWRDVVGDAGRCVSLEHFGASADFTTLYHEFGITAEAVVQAAHASIAGARASEYDGQLSHHGVVHPALLDGG
jgi:transketolase